MEKKINLYEALAGFRFQFNHLDGRPVLVSTPPGKIIGNGDTMCVEELGMPFFGRSYKYGNLFLEFAVEFPHSLTKAQVKAFRAALHTKESETRCDATVKNLYTPSMFEGTEKELLAKLHKRSADDDDEDESMGNGGQRVECSSQ